MSANDDYTEAKVLVLGAAGFIGRWVARQLCQQGADVHLVVRNEADASGVFERYSISGAIHELDLSDEVQIDDLYQDVRPDITFNLAGYGIGPGQQDESIATQINAELPAAICRAVSRIGVSNWTGQQVVHAGSAAEYGNNADGFAEGGETNPSTLYGVTKLAGTSALASCSEELSVNAVTARIFNAYGPGERPGRLLPSLIEAAKTGNDIELTDGSQRRDFVYVEDVAKGLLRLGSTANINYSAINLATGTFTTVRSFVEAAAQVLGIGSHQLKFGSISMAERERDWNMDTEAVPASRLSRTLGWVPDTDVASGITKTKEF